MRRAFVVPAAVIALGAFTFTFSAFAARPPEFSSADSVLRFVNEYRMRPEFNRVPEAYRTLSRVGALKDVDTGAVYLGFLAGIFAANSDKAEPLVRELLVTLPPEDKWLVIRAVAYSGLPDWKRILQKYAMYSPGRQVMIEKYISGKTPTLEKLAFDKKDPDWIDKVKIYLTGTPRDDGETKLEPTPDVIDTYWGYFFATGAYEPIGRIIGMLRWSKEKNSVEKLTVGNMAKFTLASNASRDGDLLRMVKWAAVDQDPETKAVLAEVIDAAENMDTVRLRKMAIAAIDDLKQKGPGYKQNISTIGQIGQAVIGLGCIAAAAAGQIEFGLPCVIGGAVSNAAIAAWTKQ
ncbi:MAG TPA: hypothetical protein VKT73_09745 [Xanthobacteraceae bacterium]|nr:hypothetical protein [Xanthobacteraceae bacterium]